MGERKCRCIIGDIVLEELGINCISEGLALWADVLDAAIVDGGVVSLLWGNRFGKAQRANGRLCVGYIREVVIAPRYLGDHSQQMRIVAAALRCDG